MFYRRNWSIWPRHVSLSFVVASSVFITWVLTFPGFLAIVMRSKNTAPGPDGILAHCLFAADTTSSHVALILRSFNPLPFAG